MTDLRALIEYHRDLYYNSTPEISDAEFDVLVDEYREAKKVIVICDHDPDGLLGGVIVGEFFKQAGYAVDYERATRYKDPDLTFIGKETAVYIVDFNYNKERTKMLLDKAGSVTILDHHKTAIEELDGLEHEQLVTIINTDKAACRVAWDFCYPADPAPFQVDYIEDMDLWRWVQPDSKEINSYLSTVPTTPDAWTKVLAEQLGDVKEKGAAVWAYKTKTMDILENLKVLMKIGDHWVPAVNCADPSIVSYLGNRLAKNVPFGATFYLQPSGMWKFSVRSITDETNPVGISAREVAQSFGGGGHDNAAGFKVEQLFEFKVIGKDDR